MIAIYQNSSGFMLMTSLKNHIVTGGLTIMPCCTYLAVRFLRVKSALLLTTKPFIIT